MSCDGASLQISDSKDHFVKDGKPFFYLADTAWLAFANATIDDWAEYLDYRKIQGFNALQMIVLPIPHDTSESAIGILPFKTDNTGKMDFHAINDQYFDRAQTMLELATERGFLPVLAPLWCNYVEGSWASHSFEDKVMPLSAVKPYMEYVVDVFSRFDPVYIISGDDNFETEKAGDYYTTMFDVVKQMSPETLTTMHLTSRIDLPNEWADYPHLDFYMYQSGHDLEHQDYPYLHAAVYRGRSIKRPIVNGEPCYEGLGPAGRYGRFSAFDVRKAIWQSLLSGAKAGVTYGAHGIWSWHVKGMRFTSGVWQATPFEWRSALRFSGAWDAGFARWVFETYDLFDIQPVEAIKNDTAEIRMSVSNDRSTVVIYAPYNVDVRVDMDLAFYDWTVIDLANRRFARPEVENRDGLWLLRMHEVNSDGLFIGVHQK